MATSIVGLASQVIASGSETIQVTGGALETVATTRWYYFVSNRVAQSNGESLLREIRDHLDSSRPGTLWTVVLTNVAGLYKIQISHDGVTSRTITFSNTFAANLGFATNSYSIASGATLTADYPSVWWWTPNMAVSSTGPELFDPSISFGVPSSAGASQRAPDMTTAFVTNGIQWSASYQWTAVSPGYLARENAIYKNRSFETWWRNGPAQGRRFLMWRNRDNATGNVTPSEGSASPWNYIEYAPQESLRGSLPIKATSPPNVNYYDVTLDCWLTENVDTPLSD